MYKLGIYVHRESPVHRLDPRVKILAVIAFSIIILHIDALSLIVATGLALVISRLARIPVNMLRGALRPVVPFFLFLFLVYVFFTPGKPLLVIGMVKVSQPGLGLGCLQIGRFILLVIIASILTMTTLPTELTIGLERLLRPIRIARLSSHDIAMMVSLALRFIPTLLQEMTNIREAQLARGANFKAPGLRGRLRAVINLIQPLSVSIFLRCDELVDAMEARGYQPGQRTYLRELVLSRTDYCLIGGIVAAVIAVLVWQP